MDIIIAAIWLILSIWAIWYTDNWCYWEHLFKVFAISSLLALMYNGWTLYDPSMNHMIVTIEINPSFEAALFVSMVEGICITGPIAAVRLLIEKIRNGKI